MLTVKVARHGIHQNWERGHAPQAARSRQLVSCRQPSAPYRVCAAWLMPGGRGDGGADQTSPSSASHPGQRLGSCDHLPGHLARRR
jgi:hypothetical protein